MTADGLDIDALRAWTPGCVHPLVRLSPHVYNTEDEIDQAIDAMAALAGCR